jgi:hypothetical protein
VHRPTGDSELKLDSGELVVGSRRYRTHGSLRIAETHRPSSEQRAYAAGYLDRSETGCRLMCSEVWTPPAPGAGMNRHNVADTTISRPTHQPGEARKKRDPERGLVGIRRSQTMPRNDSSLRIAKLMSISHQRNP